MQSYEEFTAARIAEGFDEVLVREWAPLHETPVHEHPFDVCALVTRGEFWLTKEGRTEHLRAGDMFRLARHIPHQERYGPEGATFWAARANG